MPASRFVTVSFATDNVSAGLIGILRADSDNIHLQTYISIGFTVFLIFFLVHILACFFYLIGTSDETIGGSNTTVEGWVNALVNE